MIAPHTHTLVDTSTTHAIWKEGPTRARLCATPEHVRDVVQHKPTRVAIHARNPRLGFVNCKIVPPKLVDTSAAQTLWKEGPSRARLRVTPEHVRDVAQHK